MFFINIKDRKLIFTSNRYLDPLTHMLWLYSKLKEFREFWERHLELGLKCTRLYCANTFHENIILTQVYLTQLQVDFGHLVLLPGF